MRYHTMWFFRSARTAPERRESRRAVNQDQPNATHWIVRLADSDMFRKLPANNIRILLEHIQKVDVLAGDVVINEGDPSDY
jgi:hypothetical protein